MNVTTAGNPAETYESEVAAEWNNGMRAAARLQASQERSAPAADRFQRAVEVIWREMIEDADFTEHTALEVLMRGMVKEAKARAFESGRWDQRLYDRANCLERAADAMLETVAAEMGLL